MHDKLFSENQENKKFLISGNEAFARGIYEAGVRYAANYPGTPVSEIGDLLNDLGKKSNTFIFDYSINEKVALESCIGVSWAGGRSVVMFKHVGLNIASDPLHTFPYSGVRGGMLIICGGDPGIHSSTNAQDNRYYSLHTKIPIIVPSSVQECKDYVKYGLFISEKHELPIYLHVTNKLSHGHSIVRFDKKENSIRTIKFEKDPKKYINTLKKAMNNQLILYERLDALKNDDEISNLMNKEHITCEQEDNIKELQEKIGIITSGICFSHAVEACHRLKLKIPILKLGLIYPMNMKLIMDFILKNDLKKVLIIEELEPFIENNLKVEVHDKLKDFKSIEIIGKKYFPRVGELNSDIVMDVLAKILDKKNDVNIIELHEKRQIVEEIVSNLPVREPTFCSGCPYRPVFYALKKSTKVLTKKFSWEFIFGGDISCSTLAESYPFELIDYVISMSAGIGIANGLSRILDPNKQKMIAFIGDSTFFHTGLQPIINAIKDNIDLTIIVFYNFWTAMTGHQVHVGTPVEYIAESLGNNAIFSNQVDLINVINSFNPKNLVVTDSYNINKLKSIFTKELQKSGVKIIIIKSECALVKARRLKERKERKGYEVFYRILDHCVKCNECIEAFGCPAINIKKESSHSEENEDEKNQELIYYIDQNKCIPKVCPGACKMTCKNNAIKKTIINPQLKGKMSE